MCHGKLRRLLDERFEDEGRRERLWDLFDRETRSPAPPSPIAESDDTPDEEREEVLTAARRED